MSVGVIIIIADVIIIIVDVGVIVVVIVGTSSNITRRASTM